MPALPDLPWTARQIRPGPGVVVTTHLHLRRLRDVPAFFGTSLAIRRQTMRSPGARSLVLRAEPLARRFTTVSWWDDETAVRAFAVAEPHRSAMRRWRPGLVDFGYAERPGTESEMPGVPRDPSSVTAP